MELLIESKIVKEDLLQNLMREADEILSIIVSLIKLQKKIAIPIRNSQIPNHYERMDFAQYDASNRSAGGNQTA